MTPFWRTSAILVTLLACVASDTPAPARACGGPSALDLTSLGDAGSMLTRLGLIENEDIVEFRREEFRFVYPFWRARPAEFDALWRFVNEQELTTPMPGLESVNRALTAGDLPGAARRAREVVDAFYLLPPVVAAPQVKRTLWPALEVIDLASARGVASADVVSFLSRNAISPPASVAPLIGQAGAARRSLEDNAPAPAAGGPRAAALEFASMQRAFRDAIPNGWSQELRTTVPASTFATLERLADSWEARYPKHPLRDLVALWRIRIALFARNEPRAFELAFAIYPRRPVRAVAEMLYLLRVGLHPTEAQLDALKDPLLATAFAGPITGIAGASSQRSERLWRLALTNPNAAWSVNLQERLLYAERARKLDAPTLNAITARTPLARMLVALHRARAGDSKGAVAELEALPPTRERDELLVSVLHDAGRLVDAVRVPLGSPDAREWMVRIDLDDAGLAQLAPTRDSVLGYLVNGELTRRHAYAGRWKQALESMERASMTPEERGAWRRAATLAQSPDADAALKYAAFLESKTDGLFDCGSTFARSLGERPGAPSPTPVERAARRCSNRYIQLELYARWLSAHTTDPRARGVLTLADRAYARLENTGGGDYYFWGHTSKTTPLAAELRRVGAIIRKSKPSR